MLTFELKELSQSKHDIQNKISEQEMHNIRGNGIGSWGLGVLRDYLTVEGIKAGINWEKQNIPADTQSDQLLRQYNINPTIIKGVDVTGATSNIG